MNNREKEFVEAQRQLQPVLSKKFYRLAKIAGIREDRKSFVEDLVALTILEALINSQKAIHAQTSCVKLIKVKANNVWADYWRDRFNRFHQRGIVPLDSVWAEENPHEGPPESETKIDWLLEQANQKQVDIIRQRLENYKVKEIAENMNSSPAAITMEIQRLKNKIKGRK
jgi:DNA-directed RNA polymerase specialized sigma24 family protein